MGKAAICLNGTLWICLRFNPISIHKFDWKKHGQASFLLSYSQPLLQTFPNDLVALSLFAKEPPKKKSKKTHEI